MSEPSKPRASPRPSSPTADPRKSDSPPSSKANRFCKNQGRISPKAESPPTPGQISEAPLPRGEAPREVGTPLAPRENPHYPRSSLRSPPFPLLSLGTWPLSLARSSTADSSRHLGPSPGLGSQRLTDPPPRRRRPSLPRRAGEHAPKPPAPPARLGGGARQPPPLGAPET